MSTYELSWKYSCGHKDKATFAQGADVKEVQDFMKHREAEKCEKCRKKEAHDSVPEVLRDRLAGGGH